MEWNRFEADYGTLPAAWFSVGAITNPAELFRGGEVYRLLRLSGIEDAENGDTASDWELFSSICRAYPQWKGHPIREQVDHLLRMHFSIHEEICEENCERIWHTAVADLEAHPRDAIDFLPHGGAMWLCDTLALPASMPKGIRPILFGNLLLKCSVASLSEWQRIIQNTLTSYAAAACDKIVLRIGEEFSFVRPDVYHTEQILREPRRNEEDAPILLAQLFREICAFGVEHEIPVLLETECAYRSVKELLEYAERTVGLPPLWLSALDMRTLDHLIDLMGEPHCHFIRPVLPLARLASDEEFRAAAFHVAARYPSARICVLTGADLRRISAVRERVDVAFRELL